jgi:hypothetical protein
VSDLITRTAKLVPYVKRPKQAPSYVTAYSYEPLPTEPGAGLGNLYVVLEVLITGRASEEVADLVLETIGDQYYNQSDPNDNPLERFEGAIKATNHELAEYVNRGNASWIGKLSAVVAIQADGELHVSQTGSAEAFLYRGKAATRINNSTPYRPSNPAKTFGSIATGQLEAGDRLLLATPALIHQVPLSRLQDIVGQSGPNASIAEIKDHLKGATVDRVAALVIEVTTPELAALQVRSEQPAEIQLSAPETPLDVAKIAAEPIKQSTVQTSKQVAKVAQNGWNRIKPKARSLSLAAADGLRTALSTERGRRTVGASAIGVLILIILAVVLSASAGQTNADVASYNTQYSSYQVGLKDLNSGNKSAAEASLNSTLDALIAMKSKEPDLDKALAKAKLQSGEPTTLNAFIAAVQSSLDMAKGLVPVSPSTITRFPNSPGSKHFEIHNGKAYVFYGDNLSIVNLTSGVASPSGADLSEVGNIVSTSLTSDGNGILLLTDKPDVWFYQFSSDSATRLYVTSGTSWPHALAVASFASNIYSLGSTAVMKQTRNSIGYGAPTNSLQFATDSYQTFAVDGSIYLLNKSVMYRYLSGVLKQTVQTPTPLGSPADLRSTDGGRVLVATDIANRTVVLWTATDSSLAYDKSLLVQGVSKLYDSTFDSSSGNVYALADNLLVRFSVQP